MKNALNFAALAGASVGLVATSAPSATAAGQGAPKVMYVLEGKLSAYSPYSASSPGSVTIVVSQANYHAENVVGQALTFPLDASSKVTLGNRKTISDFDNGIIKINAPKDIAPRDLDWILMATPAAQVVDQGQ